LICLSHERPRIGVSALSFFPWYAIRTKSNREKIAALVLDSKGYAPYLPLYRSRRQWSDRIVEVEEPLFAGYVFCRFDPKQRLPIITTPAVVSVVSYGNEPAEILEAEIEAIRTVLRSGLPARPCPFLREGQGVEIKQGPLNGIEGILLKRKNESLLVISVTMLQRSVLVEIDQESVRGLKDLRD
jgi:transcription antitermination factor NusG